MAGQAEARGGDGGNGPKQHAITSRNLFFEITHSTTPPGTVFFFRLGHAGPPEAASRSLKHCEQS